MLSYVTDGIGGSTSKRPAASTAKDEEDSNNLDNGASSRPSKVSKIEYAPNYGSKEYWESRYKSHTKIGDDANSGDATTANEPTTPGHEWYFSYDELQPLIMPLILGESDNEGDESDYSEDAESWVEEEDEDVSDHDEEVERDEEEEKIFEELKNEDILTTVKSTCSDNKVIVNDTTEQPGETDGENAIEGIEKINRRPKRVLEVGCGDKPLGTALICDLLSMQSKSHEDAKSIVDEVTCIDYSDTVVQRLIEKETKEFFEHDTAPMDGIKQQSGKVTNLRPTFQALDARSLPFQSNTYDLILEKGTLDAMLSDKENGLTNCIQIVKEMARVTNDGGAILIVSHLNANEQKGMVWLEDVVFNGLKAEFLERGRPKSKEKSSKSVISLEKRVSSNDHTSVSENDDKEYVWSVEVHGGHGAHRDTQREKEKDCDEETDEDEDDSMEFGPAVYIIRKKSIPAMVARELFGKKRAKAAQDESSIGGDGDVSAELVEMPPVKLSFLSYDGE